MWRKAIRLPLSLRDNASPGKCALEELLTDRFDRNLSIADVLPRCGTVQTNLVDCLHVSDSNIPKLVLKRHLFVEASGAPNSCTYCMLE